MAIEAIDNWWVNGRDQRKARTLAEYERLKLEYEMMEKRARTPSLGRSGFEFIANLIKSMQAPSDADAEHVVLFNTFKQLFALNFAKGLAKTNSNFDALMFLEACGINQTMAQAFSKATWMKKED